MTVDPDLQHSATLLLIEGVKITWEYLKGRKPTAREQRLVLASMEDIHRYDEKTRAIERGSDMAIKRKGYTISAMKGFRCPTSPTKRKSVKHKAKTRK